MKSGIEKGLGAFIGSSCKGFIESLNWEFPKTLDWGFSETALRRMVEGISICILLSLLVSSLAMGELLSLAKTVELEEFKSKTLSLLVLAKIDLKAELVELKV